MTALFTKPWPMDFLSDALIALSRRPFRSLLAVAGIATGILILLVTGSMGEYFRSLAGHVRKTFACRIYVCEKMGFWAGSGLVSEEKVPLVAGMARHVIPLLVGRLDADDLLSVGMPAAVVGLPPQSFSLYLHDAPVACGRGLEKGDGDVCVAGGELARQRGLRTGSTLRIRNRDFTVAGILERTGSLEDRQVFVPLSSAQAALMRPHILTAMALLLSENDDAAATASRVKEKIPWACVVTAKDMEKEVESTVMLWEILTFICSVLSGLSSFFAIAVVMVMAVSERRREIGIRRAFGAQASHLYGEILTEVALLCVMGWILGICAGYALIGYFRYCLAGRGFSLFLVTPGLLAGSFLWTMASGLMAGFFPVRQALALDPVRTLRQV